MSIQATFNAQSLAHLPRIVHIINNAKEFEANQMQYKALEWMGTTIKPVNEMSAEEIASFEDTLIHVFKDREWL